MTLRTDISGQLKMEETHCRICSEVFGERVLKDGPQNSDIQLDCYDWLCTECWQRIYDTHRFQNADSVFCPLCHSDITIWIYSNYNDEKES